MRRARTALRRTPVSIWNDDVSDWAAALTYYSILALLPALLVTVSVIGLAAPGAVDSLIADITSYAPAEAGGALRASLEDMAHEHSAVWLLIATGAVSALWSASSYLAVFRRALNTMHQVRDTRHPLRKAHTIVVTAVVLLVLLLTSAAVLVVTGPLARGISPEIGVSGADAWTILKWPLLLCVVTVLIFILFRSGPPAARGVRRGLPGGILAALLWLAASGGFALYATRFGSYSRLYGSLAGVVVFLVWLWFTNLSLLVGAQFNVEMARLAPDAKPEGERAAPAGEADGPTAAGRP
nr:YihY/virulence factor BrkB family protein [Streptomyces tsukubensis]